MAGVDVVRAPEPVPPAPTQQASQESHFRDKNAGRRCCVARLIALKARCLETHMRRRDKFSANFAPCPEALESRLLLSATSPMYTATGAYAAPPGIIVSPQIEQESLGGLSNDELASAETLVFSYLLPHVGVVTGLGPQQAAVTGVGEGAAGPGYDQTATIFAQIYNGRVVSVPLTGLTAPGGDGLLTINAGADLAGATKYLSLQVDGLDLGQVFIYDGVTGGRSSTQLVLTQEQLAAMAADGAASFTFTASPAMLQSGTNYIQVKLAYPGPSGGDVDYYSFELGSGESASLAVSGTGQYAMEVYDAAGAMVASADASAPGATAAVQNLLANAAGTYYVKVAGSGDYSLVVDRNATVDAGVNDSLAAAQAIAGPLAGGRQWVVGGIDAAVDADFYSLSLPSCGVLNLQAYTPAAAGQVNALTPVLRLYAAGGELVAVSQDGQLQYHMPKGGEGDYYVEVLGADATEGDYILSIKSPLKGADNPNKGPKK